MHTQTGAPRAEHPDKHQAARPLPLWGSTPPVPDYRRSPKAPERTHPLGTSAFQVGDAAGFKKNPSGWATKEKSSKPGHSPADHSAADVGGSLPACWRHAGGMLAACRRQSPVFVSGKAHFARRNVCFAARGPRCAQQTPSLSPAWWIFATCSPLATRAADPRCASVNACVAGGEWGFAGGKPWVAGGMLAACWRHAGGMPAAKPCFCQWQSAFCAKKRVLCREGTQVCAANAEF